MSVSRAATADRVHAFILENSPNPPRPDRFPSDPFWKGLQERGSELWLDTGDIEGAARLWTPEFSGLTTNNTLLNKEVQKGTYDELIDRAGQLARSINEVRIRDDRFLDLVRGCAGLLVALLALYACRGQAWVLRLARNCGDRLLELQPASAPDGAGAGEAAPRLHSGFAHGRAGIAFALSRLSAATGESRFRAAGWTLAPSPSQAGGDGNLADSWCNGRAGILLARIAGFATAGSRPDATLIAALDRLCARPLASLDHVCCGNLGRAETLLQAGLRLGEPRFCEAAATLAADVVARSRRDGEYRLGAPAGFQPVSFHQGRAGIGYQLLRLACPQQIPCVLLWE